MSKCWWHHPESDSYLYCTAEELGDSPDAQLCVDVDECAVPRERVLAMKQAKLAEWHASITEAIAAKQVIEREQTIRREVAALFFPNPEEGANNLELSAGYKLKLTYKIERKIDEGSLEAVKQQMRELGVNPDTLINMKPELATKAYKGLMQVNPDVAKVFDQCMIIKPATTPTLEVVPPKGEVK